MSPFLAELVGTALILTIGTGVVANVALPKTKGNGSGYLAVTFGWFAAVFVGVYASSAASGAHLNPAVTIGLAVAGKFSWDLVPSYLLAQLLGAMLGAILAWLAHLQQFNETSDAATKLGVFCTSACIKHPVKNILSDVFNWSGSQKSKLTCVSCGKLTPPCCITSSSKLHSRLPSIELGNIFCSYFSETCLKLSMVTLSSK